MNDLISRQAAIDEANAWLLDCLHIQKQNRSCGLIRRLEDLPSAQPEIIKCKDCKFFKGDGLECHHSGMFAYEDDYCSNGERKEDSDGTR